MKTILTLFAVTVGVMILVVVVPMVVANKSQSELSESGEVETLVTVERSSDGSKDTLAIEEYLVGVVAGEMPADFEEEALKAQAVAARTYVVKNVQDNGGESDITDTVDDQVYKDNEELKEQWGKDFETNLDKIQSAVEATKGEIITYNGDPITALFFSTSNGKTENSGDYYPEDLPYLISVESEWDLETPKYYTETSMSVEEIDSKLGVDLQSGNDIAIESRTEGDNISEVEICGKSFTGREVREKLGLKSSDFSIDVDGENVVITTLGNGHDVGMSQYGANEMAKSGFDYSEIISHYYTGVDITDTQEIYDSMFAMK